MQFSIMKQIKFLYFQEKYNEGKYQSEQNQYESSTLRKVKKKQKTKN